MLITLLYHRAITGRYGNSPQILESHFQHLKKHYPILLPFEPLIKNKWNITITFDDATYDFYYYIYPLLRKYNLKVVLAVPVSYIQDKHDTPPLERLKSLENFSFGLSPPSYAFCSYKELKEMVDSGHVMVASHGLHHVDLSTFKGSLEDELIHSKQILETKLNQKIDVFVFPYGKYSLNVLKKAKNHYHLAMRIGNSCNLSWKKFLHFRINADETNNILLLLSFKKTTIHFIKMIKNIFNSLFFL